MNNIPPSWAAELQGATDDLAHLSESQTVGELSVRLIEGRFYVLGRRFDGLTSNASAMTELKTATAVLSGLLVLYRFCSTALFIKEVVGVTLDGVICQRYCLVPVDVHFTVDHGYVVYTSGPAP